MSGAGVAFALAAAVWAQPAPYQVLTEVAPYAPIAGGVRVDPALGDGGVFQLDLPFEVELYGQRYRTLWINANGFVSVLRIGSGYHFPPSSNPSSGMPNGFIAGLWDDLCAAGPSCSAPPSIADAGIYYELSAGKVRVEYRGIRHFSDGAAASALHFSIALHSGPSGLIELWYGPMQLGRTAGGSPTPMGARIGVESADGARGMWLPPCANGCSSTRVEALPNTRIQLLVDAGEDVSIAEVNAPSVGYPDLPLSVSARYLSRHGRPLGPAQVALMLLREAETTTVGARVLASTGPITLAPYESRALRFAPALPADVAPGRYRLAVVADPDHRLAENDERNNLGFSQGDLRVLGRGPDFRATRVANLSRTVAPGGRIALEYTVANLGNERGALELGAYLSANRALSPRDLALGAPIRVELGSLESHTGTIGVSLPSSLGTGRYHVGLILDPNEQVAELDETNNVSLAEAPVDVASGEVQILTESLPPATLTVPYSARIEALGGNGMFGFRLTNGRLPRGTVFDASDAEVFGIPVEAGRFELEIEARSGAARARRTISLDVIEPELPLLILPQAAPSGVVGVDYAYTPRAMGGVEPHAWFVQGALPPGLLIATNGTVLGVPERAGDYAFGLEVRDARAATATVAVSFSIREPANVSVTSSGLGETALGRPFEAVLSAIGGARPYSWQAIGLLPSGLRLTETGTLTGTPARLGTQRFRVLVKDALGSEDTNELSLSVVGADDLAIRTSSLPEAAIDTAYSVSLEAGGGTPPYRWLVLDLLPPGLMSRAEGEALILEGRVPEAGVYAFVVRVEDAAGRRAERPFALVVPTPPITDPTTIPEEGGCAATGTPSLALLAIVAVALARRRRRNLENP